jgi:hypothetical protein
VSPGKNLRSKVKGQRAKVTLKGQVQRSKANV